MILTEFDVEAISVNEVLTGPGRRALNESAIEVLLASIKLIGLQIPISVRTDPDAIDPETGEEIGGYHLISGRHRLEAFRRLGRSDIPARVWKADSDPALVEMWEISENLHRAELTVLERAEQTARWIALAISKPGLFSQVAKEPSGGRPESGVNAASRELRMPKDEAYRSIKISSLSNEAKDAAVATSMDNNQSALLAAAKEKAPEKQVAVLQEKAEVKAAANRKPRSNGSNVIRPDATTQMAGDILDFLCRVPVDKFGPAEATEISDPRMVAAIDRYSEAAMPWIANFADAWRERDDSETEPMSPARADLLTGILNGIWLTKNHHPDLNVADIRAALNEIFKQIGRGAFNSWGDTP